jgi:hypothetical protein
MNASESFTWEFGANEPEVTADHLFFERSEWAGPCRSVMYCANDGVS